MQIIITGEVIIRKLGKQIFDVVLVRLTYAAVEPLTRDETIIMG